MLSFFTTKVMAYICAGLGIVIVGLGVALWAQNVKVGKAQNERDKARNQVTAALQTIEAQKDALKECSDKTLALKAESDKKVAAADEARLRAQQEAKKYQEANKRRDAALKAPTPPGAGCREAVAGLRGELRK